MAEKPVSHGDIQAVQGGLLAYQGQREFQTSQHGQMRWTHSKAPYQAAGSWDVGYVECPFGMAFSDEPMMTAMLSVADGEEWYGDTWPSLQSSVVNWRRVAGAQLFVGAYVSYEITGADFDQKFILSWSFYGPAVAGPLGDIEEWENSTFGPEWDAAEWLGGPGGGGLPPPLP